VPRYSLHTATTLLFAVTLPALCGEGSQALRKPIISALVEHLQSDGCEFGIRAAAFSGRYILYGHPNRQLYMRINGAEIALEPKSSAGAGTSAAPRIDVLTADGVTVEIQLRKGRSACGPSARECDGSLWDAIVVVTTEGGTTSAVGQAHVAC
jgi:hypothetical protein